MSPKDASEIVAYFAKNVNVIPNTKQVGHDQVKPISSGTYARTSFSLVSIVVTSLVICYTGLLYLQCVEIDDFVVFKTSAFCCWMSILYGVIRPMRLAVI